MQELPLLLISKQLSIILSTDKVKTLRQAQNIKNDNKKQQKVDEVSIVYERMKNGIINQFEKGVSLEDIKCYAQECFREKQNLFERYLRKPNMIQICGGKGVGKTVLALKLAEIYSSLNPERMVKIMNCASGITRNRLSHLSSKCQQVNYTDVFTSEDLLAMLKRPLKDKNLNSDISKPCIIVIDSLVNLLFPLEKPKNYLLKLNEAFEQHLIKGSSIIVTNFIQNKIEYNEKQTLNNIAYFNQYFSELISLRLLVENKNNMVEIHNIKSLENGKETFHGVIQEYGLVDLKEVT